MLESTVLIKNAPLEDSQNYELLRRTGLQHIEKLAYEIWTDYNAHDPGITLLELLSYAITDLGYRTGYDVKDLLTVEENGVPKNTSNFHTALNILTCEPVTFCDLREVLVDISGVRNAWISKNRKVQYCLDTLAKQLKDSCASDEHEEALPPLNGLFDVLLEYEDFVQEEDRIVHLGKVAEDDITDVNRYGTPGSEGLEFRARYPFAIRAVHVYARNTGGGSDNLTLRLLRQNESGVFQLVDSQLVSVGQELQKVRVPVDFQMEAGGRYRLDAQGSTLELLSPDGADAGFPYYVLQVAELLGGFDGAAADDRYYFFYDWEISFAVSPPEQEARSLQDPIDTALGLPDNSTPASGGYLNVANQGLRFIALCPLRLQSVSIYAETAGAVTIRLSDQSGAVLKTSVHTVDTPGVLTPLPLDWDIAPGFNYLLDAAGTGIRLYRTTNAEYPFEYDNAVEITEGQSNATTSTSNVYYFFYDWQLEVQPCPVQVSEITQSDIRLAARDRLHQKRNLCEDFIHIRDLQRENVAVCADLEVRPDVDIEEALAEIFYQLEVHVAPPVHFYTIQELLDRGKTTDEIFEGPILDHGFIDEEEFCPVERRCFLRTSDIIQLLMDVPGILAVKEISLLSFIEIPEDVEPAPGDQVVERDGVLYWYKEEPWILELESLERYAADFDPAFSKFIFYKNGLPYFPNLEQVLELYQDKRARHFGKKLKGHEMDLPIPVGEFKNLEDYYPAQHDLPDNYFTGWNRVPDNRAPLRKAQARQLKAYLLFFEQLLANYLSQLAHLRELFSWEKSSELHSYFTQPVTEFADPGDLYQNLGTLEADLEDIIETEATARSRKNRFLDHLIGRFSEDFTEYSLLMYSLFKNQAAGRLITDKQAFLRDYPALSSRRAQGFDYRFPERYDNLTGLQHRVYRLLGIYDDECEVGRRYFASPCFRIESDTAGEETEYWIVLCDEDNPSTLLFESIRCESRDQACALLDSLLPLGADPDHWQFNSDENYWELVQFCEGETEALGHTTPEITSEQELADRVIAYFAAYAAREGFHVIEHILLRKRTLGDPFLPVEVHRPEEDCDCVEVKDPYSFRATVLLPAYAGRFRSTRFRQHVERTLRLEAPAHVYLKICWINHCQMVAFEADYRDWLHQHAQLPEAFGGEPDLPALADLSSPEKEQMEAYRDALEKMIHQLHHLTNIFPLARLHDCEDADSEEPPITLNNTNLGSA